MKSTVFILAAAPLIFGQMIFGQVQPFAVSGPNISRQINQPPLPTSFDCAIDGSVVNSQTGEPIVRAHVTLNSTGPTPSTSTDSSGRWSLSNLPCAPAAMMVTRPGFLQQARRAANLVSGSPVHDMKIELTPQSVFYGKVLDDQGDPVMGAEVIAFIGRIAEGRITFQRNYSGNTNDLGEFRVPNVTRGKYIVCAGSRNAPGADNMVGAQTCYPGPIEGGAASAMEVTAGREIKVDFTLRAAPTVHVRGTITGIPEGRNIGISMVPRGPASPVNVAGGNGRDGKFDFRVPAGSYMISADYFEAAKHLIARVPIEVGTTDLDNVTVAVDGGFSISGMVRVDPQSRQTTLPRQFGINLRPVEPTTGAGQLKWDADHTSFAFNDMSPGAYRLDVFPPSPFYVKNATLAGQDILNGEFSVAQAAGPIEIVLSDDGGSIEGDIVNADGQPTVGGGIIALRNGRATVVQGVGHFKLQNLAPGDYTVYAWDDANQVEYADQDWMRRYGGSGTPVTVSAGQNVQVKLTQQNIPQ